MTHATTDPAPLASSTSAAAPAGRRILSQARFEAGTLLRNGEQLLVAIVLPALAMLGLALAATPDLGPGRRIDVVVPGILGLAIVSTAFTGQAISTGFDRRYGVLRLLGATPLGRGGLLAGKALAVLLVEALQLVALGALGAGLGWRPEVSGLLAAVVVWGLGTWAFVALALLLAGSVRAEAGLALANLLWVLMLGAGLVLPRTVLPEPLAGAIALLPPAGLGDGLRAALLTGTFDAGAALVLLAWALLATALCLRSFRWSD